MKFQLSPIDRYEKSSGETCKILLQNCRGSLRDFIHAPQWTADRADESDSLFLKLFSSSRRGGGLPVESTILIWRYFDEARFSAR